MSGHDETRATGHNEKSGLLVIPKFGKGWVFLIIGIVAGLIIGWGIYSPLLYAKKTQPFNFNHQAHTEAGLDCEDCHYYMEDGRFSGSPQFGDCLDCHTWTDRQNDQNERETDFLREFVNQDDELREDKKDVKWVSYSKQPDCVYFTHIAHTEMGEFDCEQCHGDHGQTSQLKPAYINRLTGYSKFVDKNMKMNDCGDCHTKYGKPENNACFVCHK